MKVENLFGILQFCVLVVLMNVENPLPKFAFILVQLLHATNVVKLTVGKPGFCLILTKILTKMVEKIQDLACYHF